MGIDDKMFQENVSQNVTIEGRRKLIVTGVRDVARFDEDEVLLETQMGTMIIRGDGMRMERFSLETGEVTASGRIEAIEYAGESPESGGIFSRLFR